MVDAFSRRLNLRWPKLKRQILPRRELFLTALGPLLIEPLLIEPLNSKMALNRKYAALPDLVCNAPIESRGTIS